MKQPDITIKTPDERVLGRGQMMCKDLTMVVHGPEVFDRGDVAILLQTLQPARTLVAGVMGRTAAEESGLPVEFSGEPPSVLIRKITGHVVLANHGKTPESGRIFGEIVSRRLSPEQGLLHLECSSHTLYLWNQADEELGGELTARTGFRLVHAESIPEAPLSSGREIRACLPGEAVCINGIVIGHATAETVVLEEERDIIRVVAGLLPKEHGLEKLYRSGISPNLVNAWCKSGTIRSSDPVRGERSHRTGRVLLIDHCGHEVYRRLDEQVCGILAIGDDTTGICGHICAHRGIPIFGIIDGDTDHLVNTGYAPGSVIVQVPEGTDDAVGQDFIQKITNEVVEWDSWVRWALQVLKDRGWILTCITRIGN